MQKRAKKSDQIFFFARHETPPSSAMMSYPGSEPIPIFGIIVGGYKHLEQADRDIADQLREAKSKER